MTLASLLKQKSKSINSNRLKDAARVKQAERQKAARLEERRARLEANEIARKVQAKERKKKWLAEQNRLIKWLTPGLIFAWNQEDIIPYNPRSDEERATAKKYLAYHGGHDVAANLNDELRNLEISFKVLQNKLASLSTYFQTPIPSVVFEKATFIDDFLNNDRLFSKVWRNKLRHDVTHFEKLVVAGYSSKLRNEAARAKKELAAKKASIGVDRDLLQITQLADALRPRIDTFRSQYWGLLNSPSSIHLVQYDRSATEKLNFSELVARRDYQLAVARHVLQAMKIYCEISYPDAIGKYMAAFGVASGEDLYDAAQKHITDPELVEKLDEYKGLIDSSSVNQRMSLLPIRDGQDVSDIVSLIYSSVDKATKTLKSFDTQYLQIKQGQVNFCPSVKIDDLSATTVYPEVDRLAYDIQWLRSPPGRKFKNQFARYLDQIASDGKYSAKLKIFSENDGLLVELPSGKEIPCDMTWESFEQLMNMLELEIKVANSSGVVKLKWG